MDQLRTGPEGAKGGSLVLAQVEASSLKIIIRSSELDRGGAWFVQIPLRHGRQLHR